MEIETPEPVLPSVWSATREYNRYEAYPWPILPLSRRNPSRFAFSEAPARQYFWRAKEPKLPRTAVVAIVDDDHSVREALTSLVRALGYVAVAFECAEGLLKSRRRASVSCLITDVQMPGMTGLELHHRLAASCKPIPTILITAFPDERARERALQAGVICCLTKPFSEDDLLACIRSILGPP